MSGGGGEVDIGCVGGNGEVEGRDAAGVDVEPSAWVGHVWVEWRECESFAAKVVELVVTWHGGIGAFNADAELARESGFERLYVGEWRESIAHGLLPV